MDRIGYPIRAVANMTGISLDTLRAWERRYEAVRPERGDRGRLYRDRDVHRLILLKELVARGYAIGQIAGLGDASLEQLSQGRAAASGARQDEAAHDRLPALLEPLFGAVEKFDPTGLDRELGRLALVFPPRALVREVIHPLLRALGDGWVEGRFSIAQEHLVSGTLRNLIGGMMRLYEPWRASATILLATPSGELHEFGILCAALLAAGGGLRTAYLGPNLPAAEIVASARKASASAVCLGLTAANPRAQAEVSTIAAGLPERIELWIGGREDILTESRRQRRWRWIPNYEDLETQLARVGARF